MIKLDKAVIVEGKYDKIKLENFIDALIITTDGFRIFKNEEKRALLNRLAQKTGLIIMTDSDSAGMLIRSHLKNIVKDGEIINVYLPQIEGKEKRKAVKSAEGLLGVEGLSEEIIINALKKSGVMGENSSKKRDRDITKAMLFEMGLSGCRNSSKKREDFYKFLDLPLCMQTNTLLDYLNTVFKKEEFLEVCEKWLNLQDS